MEEQIFTGDTGFDKLTAERVWNLSNGKTLNVYAYKGRPLFLLQQVLRCAYADRESWHSDPVILDEAFGNRVKLSDISAVKEVYKGRVTTGSWFVTEQGVIKILESKRRQRKPVKAIVKELKELFKTLHPFVEKVKANSKSAAEVHETQAQELSEAPAPAPLQAQRRDNIIEMPITKEIALGHYKEAQKNLVALKDAIIRLSVSQRGTEALMDEYDCAAEWLAEKKAALDSLGIKVAL